MKKITFNSVKIKNFLSVGHTPVEISFQKGITLITGENKDNGGKNGVGKSSIIEAVYWCLFGNTIRDIKNDKIIHNLTDSGSEVALNLTVTTTKGSITYSIIRTLKPSKLSLIAYTANSEEDLTLSTIPETEKYIKTLIGGSEELFQNAIIMSANNTLPFMAQKKVDKRKFIEGILNLNIFSDILLKARSDFNDYKKENDSLSQAFVTLQKNLETFEHQKANAETKKQEKINIFKQHIEDNKKTIDELKNKDLPTIKDVDDEIKKLEDKVNTLKIGVKSFKVTKSDLVTKNSNISAEIKQLEKEKEKIISKGNICPTCNREYCEDDINAVEERLSEINEEIMKLRGESFTFNSEITNWDNKIEEIENGIEKINKKIRDLEKIKSDIRANDQKISNHENNIKDCEKWIKDLEEGDPSIDQNIDRTKQEIEKTEKKLKDVKKNMAILDSVKFIVSEEGVKTFIIKKLLSILNNKLNYYLKILDTPCKCEFNELFEETIYNDKGKECSYHNFSGGEKVRINIAVLFTFQDILRSQSGTSYSLNIYDELLDSAIDQKGAEKILEILKDKVEKNDESIYIVSHNSNIKSSIDNVIELAKTNGSTKIVN